MRALTLLPFALLLLFTGCHGGPCSCALPPSGTASEPPAAASSGRLPQGGEAVRLDPADFTVDITNRYWPMKVGDRWIYEEIGYAYGNGIADSCT